MKNYDVIIVGAGIAGTSLAYNLSQECPEKKVLLIDKKEPGANAAYGYRNTNEEVVKKYNLPYEHIYKGIKVGTSDKIYLTLNRKFYFLNYNQVCKNFLNKSSLEFRKENATQIQGNVLKTDGDEYKFKNLVDCSGNNFFAKKRYKQKLPFRFWIGKTKVLKNKLKDTNYYYYQFSDSGYQEDLYPLKDKTLQGDWQYVKEVDFKKIIPDKKTLYNTLISNQKIINESKAVIPCTPVFPMVYKKIAFLGDSFGNPFTSSACGIEPILDASKLLTKAIKKNNLNIYEKIWKKKYLENNIRYLVTKYDSYHNTKFLQWVKKTPTRTGQLPTISKYPEFFGELLDAKSNVQIPKEIKKLFPKRSKIFQTYYYFYLKSKYALM